MQTETIQTTGTTDNAKALAAETTAEETQPAAPSGDGTQEVTAASEDGATAPGTEAQPPKKTNAEKRIGKLTRQKNEEKRRADYWEQEARRLQGTKETQTQTTELPKELKEPKQEDFGTYGEYTQALVDYKVEVRERDRQRRDEQNRVKQEVATAERSYQEKLREFSKAKPDFNERLAAVSDVNMPLVLQERLKRAGPEVIYEMMDDPDEFRRICSMDIGDAIEEIGLVKARLKGSTSKPEEPSTTQPKPKPPTPVGSKVTPVKDWKKMSIREYDEWRRKGNIPTG